MNNKTTIICFKTTFYVLTFFVLAVNSLSAQFLLKTDEFVEKKSIYSIAQYVNVGQKEYSFSKIYNSKDLKFTSLPNENSDFGFTNDNIWLKFELKNTTNEELIYFFETARPITDVVELYIIKKDKSVKKVVSGDKINYKKRDIDSRKSIFKIRLQPNEYQLYYLHVKSDGELLSMPMILHSFESLMKITSFEQFIFGLFYGILVIASILYMFFFFAMRDQRFFYYSLYVVFIGFLQFSVDGYFYQLITPQSGWFSLHAVMIFATVANFFLGRYAQVFLKIKNYNKFINYAFYGLYCLDFLSLLSLFIFPNFLKYLYPIANGLGLILLILIISSIVSIYNNTKKIDRFFAVGIFFLILGFVVFILKNFSVIPLTFWSENGSKFGTGLEVVFLSLSMANLIRNLKNEREDLQTLALRKSEEMNDLKSYFLSNISHELRTPLNTITNFVQSIIGETDSNTILEKCKIIENSSKSLLSSVNDILDFSKIEKNEIKLEISDFDIHKLLDEIKGEIELRAKNKNLAFQFSIPADLPKNIVGDENRIRQIIMNLLINAIRFTNDGMVKFNLENANYGESEIILKFIVSDTGIGISKEKLSSIFDSFSQENINNKRKYGGLGLGLYIVKALVNLHNGKIDIESIVNQGTVCKVNLKLTKSLQQANTIVEVINDYDLKGKNILVVEDNAMNQMVIKMITKKWLNTTVDYAFDGQEGINLLQKNKYDIILMDLQMPVMDGYEATIAIRGGNCGINDKNIPIIAVTADVMETTKIKVIEIGMNKYLSKPVNKEILFAMIKEIA